MESVGATGGRLKNQVLKLILRTVRNNPQGLQNVDIGRLTGLEPKLSKHRGYVCWSYLMHLLETKKLRREGRKYFLAS